MDEKYLSEVPLSNTEVLKVLKQKKNASLKTTEFVEYLESIQHFENKYPLEELRNIKESLNCDLNTLAIISNTSNLDSLSKMDRKKITNHFNQKR
jgi:hypothetical protein